MKRLRINFNPYNRDKLCEVLDEQLSQGFKLNKAHPVLGFLGFVPIESSENITYKIAIQQTYDKDCITEPWVCCGTVGSWEIFRYNGDDEKPLPKTHGPTISEEQLIRKGRKRSLVCGIIMIAFTLLALGFYIPDMIKSAAYMVNELTRGMWILPICWLGMGIIRIVEYFDYPQKNAAQDNSVWSKGKWFSQYVLPWIIAVPIIILIIFYWDFEDLNKGKPLDLPDERLPFSEKAETGVVVKTLAGNIYRYDAAFLYDVRSEKLAERLFEEAAEDDPHGDWHSRRFVNCDLRTEIPADKYENLDRILSCTEDHEFYELTYNMVVALRGEQVFGYCYDKEEYTEEEFLAELNDFYGKAEE